MKKVFISGSMSIKQLDDMVIRSLDKIISQNMQVLVGDAKGVDKLVQEYCAKNNYFNIIVYTILDIPRNLISNKFSVNKILVNNLTGRKAQEKKDEAMTKDSNYSFVIWDGKSKGSLNNILRAIELKQKLKVFYQKENRFLKENELTKNNIVKIYYKNSGLTLQELSKYTNQNINSLREIIKNYQEYFIYSKNKLNTKYSFELIDKIKSSRLF